MDMALPSHQALPSNAVRLIREYSKPLTRPEWRSLHRISNYQLLFCITNDNISTRLLNIINRNMQSSDWFCMFSFIELWGLTHASIRYGVPYHELIQMNGIIYAVNNYVIMNDNIRRLRD